MQRLDEFLNARRELERFPLDALLYGLPGGLNEGKTGSQGVLELHITTHCLGGPGGDLLALTEVGGKDINSLLVDYCAVNVCDNRKWGKWGKGGKGEMDVSLIIIGNVLV